MRNYDLDEGRFASATGFPEYGYDEPDPDPYEDPNETQAELEARVKRTSAWAKKYLGST